MEKNKKHTFQDSIDEMKAVREYQNINGRADRCLSYLASIEAFCTSVLPPGLIQSESLKSDFEHIRFWINKTKE